MHARIDGVRVAGTPQGPTPVVLLDVEGTDDVLPIFIGFSEAQSIAQGIDATDIGRPMTHDLLLDIIEELGGRVDRVVITEITDDGTYIADLHVATPRGETVIDARPSDAMALAARTNASIDVAESVFNSGRREAADFDGLSDIRELGGQ